MYIFSSQWLKSRTRNSSRCWFLPWWCSVRFLSALSSLPADFWAVYLLQVKCISAGFRSNYCLGNCRTFNCFALQKTFWIVFIVCLRSLSCQTVQHHLTSSQTFNLAFQFLRFTSGSHLVMNPLYLLRWSLLSIVDSYTSNPICWRLYWIWLIVDLVTKETILLSTIKVVFHGIPAFWCSWTHHFVLSF